ncbi:hypothetical protein [Pantoea ananatis]|uniref:hypothetical protein n=1 Tax=Pantoea ananas TaxID=553 RepID=UPI001B311CD2|nr:hypothetical protein [Pantoea ananatis]
MSNETQRRPSPLQRRILIVLAAIEAKRPGRLATRDLERLLAQGGDAPVYGPNLRASCRRLEAAGWLRLSRARDLTLAAELTDAGRAVAAPLLQAEREAAERRRQETQICILASAPAADAGMQPVTVTLEGEDHVIRAAAYVIRLDGSLCLQLERSGGGRRLLTGDALQVAEWYRICQQAGLPVRVQVNPDTTDRPGDGGP